jgi:hypothetical protein
MLSAIPSISYWKPKSASFFDRSEAIRDCFLRTEDERVSAPHCPSFAMRRVSVPDSRHDSGSVCPCHVKCARFFNRERRASMSPRSILRFRSLTSTNRSTSPPSANRSVCRGFATLAFIVTENPAARKKSATSFSNSRPWADPAFNFPYSHLMIPIGFEVTS